MKLAVFGVQVAALLIDFSYCHSCEGRNPLFLLKSELYPL